MALPLQPSRSSHLLPENSMVDPIDERAVLFGLYNSTGGPRWLRSWNMNDTTTEVEEEQLHHCDFEGITCDSTKSHIISIVLPSNRLVGSVPSSLYEQLPFLQVLDLHDNPLRSAGWEQPFSTTTTTSSTSSFLQKIDFSQTFITDFTGLERFSNSLTSLRVSSRQHRQSSSHSPRRPFPNDIFWKLTHLEVLHLERNAFTGRLSFPTTTSKDDTTNADAAAPQEQPRLNLKELVLRDNYLTGSIPDEIGMFTQLRILDLSRNDWTGTLPSSGLSNLVRLQLLNLQGRRRPSSSSRRRRRLSTTENGTLGGPLPDLATLAMLDHLFLGYNALTGSIPSTFLAQRLLDDQQPVTISLRYNQFTGTIPEAPFVRFEALNLDLEGNAFEGPIPDSFCKKSSWMNGAVARFGCDAILCGRGTFHPHLGRQKSSDEPCRVCADSSLLGATSCTTTDHSKSTTLPTSLREAKILAEFFYALDGPRSWYKTEGWKNLIDWYSGDDCDYEWENMDLSYASVCEFHGVMCGSNGQVQVLTLANNRLVGTVPNSIFQLEQLQSLDLSFNPHLEWDFNATNEDGTTHRGSNSLTRLRLSKTSIRSLTGISTLVGTCLQELALDGCNFKGMALQGEELYALTNLQTLQLEDSFFGGTISSDIRKLSNLKQYVYMRLYSG